MLHDSEVVQIVAMLRNNILGWPGVEPTVQRRIAHFIILDRARLRDRLMIQLGYDTGPPDGCLYPNDSSVGGAHFPDGP